MDWMVDRNLKQWRTVVDYVNRRRQADYDERLIGEVGDAFEYNRGQLLRSVGKNATGVVQRYDRERESEQLALSMQGAVAQTAAFEVGRGGHRRRRRRPGHDPLPGRDGAYRRRQSSPATACSSSPTAAARPGESSARRPTPCASAWARSSGRQFETELSRSIERMREAIAPYTRFVRTEHARMTGASEDLAAIDAEADALQGGDLRPRRRADELPLNTTPFRCRLGRRQTFEEAQMADREKRERKLVALMVNDLGPGFGEREMAGLQGEEVQPCPTTSSAARSPRGWISHSPSTRRRWRKPFCMSRSPRRSPGTASPAPPT